jgi:hypothetical protein
MYYMELTYPKSKKGDLALENVTMSLNEKYNADPKIYANEGCGLVVGDAKLWTYQFPKLLAHFEALGLKVIHSKLDHMILLDEPIAIFILQRKESSVGLSPDEVAVQMAAQGQEVDHGDYMSAKASKDSNDDIGIAAKDKLGSRSPVSPSYGVANDVKADKEPTRDVTRLLQLLEEGTKRLLEEEVTFREGFNVNIFPIDRTTNFSNIKTVVDSGVVGNGMNRSVSKEKSAATLSYQNLYQNLDKMKDPHYDVTEVPVTRAKNELKHVFKDLAGFHRDMV